MAFAAASFASMDNFLTRGGTLCGTLCKPGPRFTGLAPNLSRILGLVRIQPQVRQSKNKPSIVPVVVIDAALG